MEKVKIGIIICDRYRTCAGGKCFRSAAKREGAFSAYKDTEIEIAAFTTCGGCPGGNIEYAPEEMAKNGVTHIHFATGFLVGYPPCPYMDTFKNFLEKRYGVKVIIGTHPIPQKYLDLHAQLGTWDDPAWKSRLSASLADESMRKAYN